MTKKPTEETFKAWKAWSKTQISLKSYDLSFKYKDGFVDFSAGIITFYNNPKARYRWHRLDGPAVIDKNGITGYWIENRQYSHEEYWNHPLVKERKFIDCLLEVLDEQE